MIRSKIIYLQIVKIQLYTNLAKDFQKENTNFIISNSFSNVEFTNEIVFGIFFIFP